MLEKASSTVESDRRYKSDQQFDDILGVIDERIAKQEETVRNMRAGLEAEELALERLKLAREPLVRKADFAMGRNQDVIGPSGKMAAGRLGRRKKLLRK